MSDTLTLAKKEYTKADASSKEILERIFGKNNLQINWRDIKTPEDAYAANGVTVDDVLPYKNPVTPKQVWLNAISTMEEIVRAINPGFFERIDWSTNQRKWRAWFEYNKGASGFRFDVSIFDFTDTYSTGGSRLCSEDEERSNYIATQFIDIWNIILLK